MQDFQEPPVPRTVTAAGTIYKVLSRTKLMLARKTGNAWKFWFGYAVTSLDGTRAFTTTETWSVNAKGKESKHVFSRPSEAMAKNVGRSNEVLPVDQAQAQITSDLASKRDRMYWGFDEDEPAFLDMPMTAKTFGVFVAGKLTLKDAKHIRYPALAQPKYDGTRMLFDGKKGWTRKLKLYIPEVIQHLATELPEGFVLDGELQLPHDRFTFQDCTKAIRKFRPDVSPQLQLHVYDVRVRHLPDLDFVQRQGLVTDLLGRLPESFQAVESVLVYSVEDVVRAHDRFVEQGYEGAMVRNLDGKYLATTSRSGDLQKLKGFVDDEFKIVGVKKGTTGDIPIFVCLSENGTEFDAPMDGPDWFVAQMWRDREAIVESGGPLTVRYQGLTDKGSLRFPRGREIRDYE